MPNSKVRTIRNLKFGIRTFLSDLGSTESRPTKPALAIPNQEVLGQGLESLGSAFEKAESGKGCIGQVLRQLAGFFQTNNRRIRGFLRRRVLAGGLSQLLAGLGDIQDVVDDLEREPDIVSEVGQRPELSRGAIGAHATE